VKTEEAKKNMNLLKLYLRRKGIPDRKIDEIRTIMVEDALEEARDLKMDRVYTAVALAICRAYGFGQLRVSRGLREFDQIMLKVADDKSDWPSVMEELDKKTGIVIRMTDTEDRLLCEYRGRGARKIEIEKAERGVEL